MILPWKSKPGRSRHTDRDFSEGQFNAIVLAEAGLTRLGIYGFRVKGSPRKRSFLHQTRERLLSVARADPSLIEVLSALDHPGTRKDVAIERAVMEQVGTGYSPWVFIARVGT